MAMQQMTNEIEEVKRDVVEVKRNLEEVKCLWYLSCIAPDIETEYSAQGRR